MDLMLALDGVSMTYEYDAFGNEKVSDINDTNPFRYCGEYFDGETGLIYLRARYYDPSVGRFISEDPVRAGTNWYIYANNNPIMFIDPMGEDAIIITNSNSVDLPVLGKQGHTSALYQDADGKWYYTYWGDKAVAVIRIPDEYMISLDDFNTGLNKFLSENGFSNITSDYTDATYIVGDFTASLKAAYDDVDTAANHKKSTGTTYSLDDGSKVYQGKNGAYKWNTNNCFDRTYASLSKGTLANGMNAGKYMKDLGFKGGMVPNNAKPKFAEVFINKSFTYSGAYADALNYATLYVQKHPWAQKWLKANYANAIVGW